MKRETLVTLPFIICIMCATFMLMSPNIPVEALVRIRLSPVCNCSQDLTFTWRGSSHTNTIYCITCNINDNLNGTLQDMFVSYANPSMWSYKQFGTITVSISLYIIGIIWLVMSFIISKRYFPTRREIQTTPPIDIKVKHEYVVEISDRGESVLPKLAIGLAADGNNAPRIIQHP